jgi:uncharacterized iron-regulated membrane protein
MYAVRSSLDVDDVRGNVTVAFDGDDGTLRSLDRPTGERSGNTVSNWLYALHLGNVFGLPYRVFVCALGLAIAMLSATGVYIWWKKRKARVHVDVRRRTVKRSKRPNSSATGLAAKPTGIH